MKKSLKNQCQLITYPDSIGNNIGQLHFVLNKYFRDAVKGIHILPFYPSSGDRGFAPLEYTQVDPAFGNWEDINKLGEEYDLMVDFMVNHISQQSKYFQDFVLNKDKSKYADLFLRYKKLSFDGEISPEDFAKIYTRKPRPPFYEVIFQDCSKEKVWCTFDYEQIDIDVFSEVGKEFILNNLIFLARQNIAMLRVDAFGYTVKKLGTNCFFVEPETIDLLKNIDSIVKPFNVELLPEIHEHYSYQLKLADNGFWVYDFALPLLCLQALYEGYSTNLLHWLTICPRKQITTLDTHDGLPVVDVFDLMTEEEIERTKEHLFSKGANVQKRYSTDPEYKNLDIYQINCTYYSALSNNDDAYILARAIQFFTPGIPQVYYVGLLAGPNDIDRVEATKVGRDINRHSFTLDEIKLEVDRSVVKRLRNLMVFRNNYDVFNGEFSANSSSTNSLEMTWQDSGKKAVLTCDLKNHFFKIKYILNGDWKILQDV
jgi:sucrose phosphorylase